MQLRRIAYGHRGQK
ncbi:Protein of unknown function [Bacillus cereus]|uniref:Uncharacterized protein n=1 Tax=Bacillus cytotoxicus TaxID=580165 RepID=A0AAX2CJQ4_9BACI|nr:Protein of unknown function [Bacillus cereus]SCL99132.1 Protein of unknown function [Bacillus cytotoxicus]SCV24533.1 Protein of unknown function [Bacillus wiedmannii]